MMHRHLEFATKQSLFPTAKNVLTDPVFVDQKSPFFGDQQVNKLYADLNNVGCSPAPAPPWACRFQASTTRWVRRSRTRATSQQRLDAWQTRSSATGNRASRSSNRAGHYAWPGHPKTPYRRDEGVWHRTGLSVDGPARARVPFRPVPRLWQHQAAKNNRGLSLLFCHSLRMSESLIVPLFYSGYLSFFATRLVGGVRFVGFDNYVRGVQDPALLAGLGRMALFLLDTSTGHARTRSVLRTGAR